MFSNDFSKIVHHLLYENWLFETYDTIWHAKPVESSISNNIREFKHIQLLTTITNLRKYDKVAVA